MASLEALLSRDRILVLASLFGLALLAWLYLFHLVADMSAMNMPGGGMENMPEMPGMAMPAADPAPSPLQTFAFLAAMWAVMMVGMMLPSAAPTILLFAAVERKRVAGGPYSRTALFIAGYFLVWGLFSIAAAALQTGLSRAGMLSGEVAMTSALVGGAVFILAGIYEFTPLKNRCLAHCRSPFEWISYGLRPGPLGALRAGAGHGAFCVGCCWVLMLLLFVGGVMNLLWVAALAAVVLVEKVLPGGTRLARFTGVVLMAVGVGVIARPFLG